MKFRNIKKNKKPTVEKSKKSPSNSRSIPDFAKASSGKPEHFSSSMHNLVKGLPKLWDIGLKITVLVTFIFAVVIVGLDAYRNFQIKQGIDLEREELLKELSFWELFIDEHGDYRDAYFNMSALEYRLGNTSRAKEYAEKGLMLDPNSKNGKKIEDFLRGR
ncbi:MAG: tetratricopeptide repeat protein [Candidatus Levybacteria bacterium]|nr:tetratricopeptide repeat protein [Candidatus Levybacteria bacterium]MDZ4228598.1 tetratricopeptide repeat protein [Candidatus Levybacteria bacterium]